MYVREPSGHVEFRVVAHFRISMLTVFETSLRRACCVQMDKRC